MAVDSGFEWDFKMIALAWAWLGVEVGLQNQELHRQSRIQIAEINRKLDEVLKLLKENKK